MKKNINIREIEIPSEAGVLRGILTLPQVTTGIVVFAHGSGSGRFSPRNQYVAQVLNEAGLGTLLMDLLTPEEEIDNISRHLRFDIELLARRLEEATQYLSHNETTKKLSMGYFGSSTGAAAALVAAARQGKEIKSVVSRGGRPDLAGEALKKIVTPTLLIVGGNDSGVIELNQQAFELILGEKDFKLVPGATHLFEEPGALEEVAKLACSWFVKHLNITS